MDDLILFLNASLADITGVWVRLSLLLEVSSIDDVRKESVERDALAAEDGATLRRAAAINVALLMADRSMMLFDFVFHDEDRE
jgi:hypothetical protein